MFQPETLKKWGWKNCHWINLESAEFFFQEISYDQNQVVEWKKKKGIVTIKFNELLEKLGT